MSLKLLNRIYVGFQAERRGVLYIVLETDVPFRSYFTGSNRKVESHYNWIVLLLLITSICQSKQAHTYTYTHKYPRTHT